MSTGGIMRTARKRTSAVDVAVGNYQLVFPERHLAGLEERGEHVVFDTMDIRPYREKLGGRWFGHLLKAC